MKKYVHRTRGVLNKSVQLFAVFTFCFFVSCGGKQSKDISKLELVLGKKVELDGLSMWWDNINQVIKLRYHYHRASYNEDERLQSYHEVDLPPSVLSIQINQDEIVYSYKAIPAFPEEVDSLGNKEEPVELESIPMTDIFCDTLNGVIMTSSLEHYHDEDGKRLRSIPMRNYNFKFIHIPRGINKDSLLTHAQLTPPAESSDTEGAGPSTAGKIKAVFYQKTDAGYRFLRFYYDGLVISVGYADNRDISEVWPSVSRWFTPSTAQPISRGRYVLDGAQIKFTMNTVRGAIDYIGTYKEKELTLSIHSHITGHKKANIKYTRIEKAD